MPLCVEIGFLTLKNIAMKNKNIVLLRIFMIFLASAIFISCSKDQLGSDRPDKTTGAAKEIPVWNYGGISGKLTPVPSYAVLKIYNDDEHFGTSASPDMNGNFNITNLIPGTYRIVVVYIPSGAPPNSEYSYHEIRGIIVEPGTVTQLGDIILSPE